MSTEGYRDPSAWSGWVVFAGIVIFTIGCLNAIMGFVALFKEQVFVVEESGLVVTTDYDTWGWALIIWGAIMILTAIGLFSGKEWARWVALIAVVINLIGQFAWFPSNPIWSLIVIGLDVAVIYALTAGWKEVKAELAG